VNTSPCLSSLVQYFFTQHLCEHRRSSCKTVVAYRDTFRLLLSFLQSRTGRAPTSLTMADLDAPAILAFLEHLEVGGPTKSVPGMPASLPSDRSFESSLFVTPPIWAL